MTEAVLSSKKKLTEEEIVQQTDIIVAECSGREGALIPVLQAAQGTFGYLPEISLKRISEKMDIHYSEVAGVVSFYKNFSIVPQGKYVIQVCLGTSCYVRGGKEVLKTFRDVLGIDIDQTTEDELFSLKVGRCFGACGLAPVVMVNDEVYQRVKPGRIEEIVQDLRDKESEGE
ncbi:MAG: NAD(P)H-dependent oxidoreductase subunit E [Spirochaetales bacterium]|nr:NAD(P)H-dependent oxidoreductase subunit E [Spirochaetales bacterium]